MSSTYKGPRLDPTKLKRVMDKLGVTKQQLRNATGYSASHLNNILSGHLKVGGRMVCKKLADALNVSPNKIYAEAGAPDPEANGFGGVDLRPLRVTPEDAVIPPADLIVVRKGGVEKIYVAADSVVAYFEAWALTTGLAVGQFDGWCKTVSTASDK